MNKRSFSISSLFLAVMTTAVSALALTEPCIEDGSCSSITFSRPPLGVGDPADAKYDGTADAWEDDQGWGDDFLGAGTPSRDDPNTPQDETGESASVNICNSSGHLTVDTPGVGEKLNGGLEGDCIEVYMRFKYTYTVTISRRLSPRRWESIQIIRQGYKKVGPTDLCPCAD